MQLCLPPARPGRVVPLADVPSLIFEQAASFQLLSKVLGVKQNHGFVADPDFRTRKRGRSHDVLDHAIRFGDLQLDRNRGHIGQGWQDLSDLEGATEWDD